MTKRNPHLAKLHAGYLFPEIYKRKMAFLAKNPQAQILSLGIGDTTEPIPPTITKGLEEGAKLLGTTEGYSGYGPEKGNVQLREKIASKIYQGGVSAEDIFISDGSKCDIGRLQVLFGSSASIAVQDPTYPAYVDSAVAVGKTGGWDSSSSQYRSVVYMACNPQNDFFPNLNQTPRADVIFFCSPNNPTGAVATHDQLEQLVKYAKEHRSLLIYDAAYSPFIQDDNLPRSIYEIEGAHEVAIELGSFSKMAGFTGVRLGWSVVPERLKYDDGESVHADWSRLHHTIFNGASNIAQAGGQAVLTDQGWQEVLGLTRFYLENARLIRQVFEKHHYPIYGGQHIPYLWVEFRGRRSWDIFEDLLESAHILGTPGVGFGPSGEGFLRLSAFGHRENILEAARRLDHWLTIPS